MPKIVLLPGMDGTGDLFKNFVDALPDDLEAQVVSYPGAEALTYSELLPLVRSVFPASEPFVLVAESFSSPLAVQLAALGLPNLGLILCVGFVTSPVGGWQRAICRLFASFLFRVHLSGSAARLVLLGNNAPDALVAAVQAALSSVEARVLSARLRAILNCDARVDLRKVSVPILYIQARHDRLVPTASFGEIRRIKPETALEIVDGPHLLVQREPQVTANIVAKFVEFLI